MFTQAQSVGTHSADHRASYCFGPFFLNDSEHLLLRDAKPVELTPKIYCTLLALVSHAGHLLAKDELMKEVWPDAVVEESGLARNVCLLRKILGDNGHPPRYIETIPRLGYRFVAPVTEVRETALTSRAQPPVRRDVEPMAGRRRTPDRRIEVALMVLAAILAVLAILITVALLLSLKLIAPVLALTCGADIPAPPLLEQTGGVGRIEPSQTPPVRLILLG
ncbi:MAG TPA: transcriptional regulator [Terriglobales bacterium]|nr:transcriptional regulator [Terriglobales bacterium]